MRRLRVAVVSCHAERVLDDAVWERYALFERRWPVASLMRPPAPEDGEQDEDWLERARSVRLLGHHTHWGGVSQARPVGDGDPAERVLREGRWLQHVGLEARFFCGGGWYLDRRVAAAVAELGYVDTTATAYRLPYLAPGEPHVRVERPSRLLLPDGGSLLELPATHSVGMLARALHRSLPDAVHVHFHDWDLLDRRSAAALEVSLRVLRARRRLIALDELAARVAESAPEVPLQSVAGGQAGSHT